MSWQPISEYLPGPCGGRDSIRGPCTAEAVCEVVVGCIHEHVGVERVCQRCRERGERLAGRMICRSCAEHPTDPHDCPATLTYRAGAPVPVTGTGTFPTGRKW